MVNPKALQKYSLFGGLDEDQIKSILPYMKEDSYGPNEFMITEGKANDSIFFLLEGSVEVTKKNIFLAKFGEGEAFGEMEVLDVMPAIATIKSLSSVKVLSISNRGLQSIYKSDIKAFSLIIMNLARDLSRRLRRMDDKVTSPENFI